MSAFSSMEYPHWLMIAGAVLLVLGFIGLLVFRQNDDAEAEIKKAANGNEQGRSEFEDEPVQTQAADRKARLAELRRERWAKTGGTEEPLIYEPKASDKDPK
jgi:hypothetical protein